MSKVTTILMFSAVVMFVASPALAHPVNVYSIDGPQDLLDVDGQMHEAGWGSTFPFGEVITSLYIEETEYSPCPESDDPYTANVVVEITDVNYAPPGGIPLWYVADPETSLTNNDGRIGNVGLNDDELAFKIDAIGLNTPLIFESMAQDNLFEPGETWRFIIQDYANTRGLSSHLFDTLDIAGNSAGDNFSSGSIIPEPATMSLLALGGIGALLRRRRRK